MRHLTDEDLREIARLDVEIAHLESELGLKLALREVVRTGRGYPPAVPDGEEADRANERSRQLRALVCRQMIVLLEDDLRGGEMLMKEVWEECARGTYDRLFAEQQIEEILAWLRARDLELRRVEPSA